MRSQIERYNVFCDVFHEAVMEYVRSNPGTEIRMTSERDGKRIIKRLHRKDTGDIVIEHTFTGD